MSANHATFSIECYDKGTYVGSLTFHKDGAPIPPDEERPENFIRLHYTASQFNDVIGILRHEKPLYLRLAPSYPMGHISTSEREPVGEEET